MLTPVADLVAQAKTQIKEYSSQELIKILADPNPTISSISSPISIIDIRDVRERQKLGCIPNSFHCPRGMIEFWVDPQSPYHKPIFAENYQFILHCASGWRSALTTLTLNQMGFECAHLSDGFAGWVKAGGNIETIDSSRKPA